MKEQKKADEIFDEVAFATKQRFPPPKQGCGLTYSKNKVIQFRDCNPAIDFCALKPSCCYKAA